ncbi:MAG: hypothetical protein PHS47_06415 [Methanocellales archaeon]|nr:hypothetical protein [Methanocellales archaeon]
MTANHSRMDLQLFAEAEGDTPPEAAPDKAPDKAPEPDKAPDKAPEPDKQPDKAPEMDAEEFDEIVYNKETVKVPKSQRVTLLQKGYDYDKVRKQRDDLKNTLEEVAKSQGFSNTDEYLKAIEKARIEREAEEEGIPPEVYTRLKTVEEKAKRYDAETLINQQREEIMKDSKRSDIFKTHENEILPLARQAGDLNAAYAWFVAENFDKLTEEIRKQAVEDHKRQASKGGVQPSNEGTAPDDSKLDFTKEEEAWARHRVSQGHYKTLREAWEWLRGKR